MSELIENPVGITAQGEILNEPDSVCNALYRRHIAEVKAIGEKQKRAHDIALEQSLDKIRPGEAPILASPFALAAPMQISRLRRLARSPQWVISGRHAYGSGKAGAQALCSGVC